MSKKIRVSSVSSLVGVCGSWVHLVVVVMMVVCCTVQDSHSYLGHCQAEVVELVEGRRWCCCQWLCCHLDWMELNHQCYKRKSRTTDLQLN